MNVKSYDELEFTDDFLFSHILMDREDLCRELAELITGRRIREIVHPEGEKSIRLTYDGKGVRFDVYFEDESGVVYDIEMQASKKYNLRRRSRYYQGMIDLNVLKRSSDYERLQDSYIIFICTFDEFGKGRHVYTFEDICLEDTTIRLEDGARKIFLCASGEMNDCSEKMREFLDYLAARTITGEFSARIDDEVKRSRAQEEWRLDYMTLEEKYREKYKEGLEQGIERGIGFGEDRELIKLICRKLRKGKDYEQIAEELEEDETQIKAICDMAEEFAPEYKEEQVIHAWQCM